MMVLSAGARGKEMKSLSKLLNEVSYNVPEDQEQEAFELAIHQLQHLSSEIDMKKASEWGQKYFNSRKGIIVMISKLINIIKKMI